MGKGGTLHNTNRAVYNTVLSLALYNSHNFCCKISRNHLAAIPRPDQLGPGAHRHEALSRHDVRRWRAGRFRLWFTLALMPGAGSNAGYSERRNSRSYSRKEPAGAHLAELRRIAFLMLPTTQQVSRVGGAPAFFSGPACLPSDPFTNAAMGAPRCAVCGGRMLLVAQVCCSLTWC